MERIIEFLKMRRRNLLLIKDQVPFRNVIKDKREARNVLRGRLNEIDRILRKLNNVGIEEMILKEENSYKISKRFKNEQVKNSQKLSSKKGCGKYLGFRFGSGNKAYCGDDDGFKLNFCEECSKKEESK